MALILREVATKSDLKTFIYLPERINANNPSWLPPIYIDEKKFFNPAKNRSFKISTCRFMLAFRDGVPVGRVLGIINRQHNEMHNLRTVRFGFFECYDDQEVAHALISDIENWGRAQGMDKIIGPYGFSDRDIQGLLVEGFEHEAVIDSATNAPYLPKLVEHEGYVKELDCVIYRYPLVNELPEIYKKIFNRIVGRSTYQFMEFTKRKQFKHLIAPVLKSMNESFKDIYGFIPVDDSEIEELAKRYVPLIDPRFVKVVMKDDKVAAFLLSMPNMTAGIQKARGRLFPFGLFRILRAMKKAKSVNTILGAVSPDFQKQGLDVFLSMTTFASARKAGMTSVDTHVVMEENDDMMAELKRYGAFLLKRFRVYQKAL